MNEKIPDYDVLIVGGGVVGTALLYTLSKYTDIKKIGLIEKYSDFGLVNSASYNNSQTLHFGDIETNYSFEKAKCVKEMADMVMKYLESEKLSRHDIRKYSANTQRWFLAVGKKQVEELTKDSQYSASFFLHLRIIDRDEIGKIEPRVVEGRDPDQEIVALVTEDGYTVDFKRLCHSFVDNAIKANLDIDIHLETKLLRSQRRMITILFLPTRENFILADCCYCSRRS